MAQSAHVQELKDRFARFHHLLISPDGRSLMDYLTVRYAERRTESTERTVGGIYKRVGRTTSFCPGDPHETAFHEGERSVVLFLKDLQEGMF